MNSSMNIEFISTSEFLGGTVEVLKALDSGGIVAIMGDRSYGTQTIEASFLGEKAYFPYSAFFFAASANCPVVPFYVVKENKNSYKVHMNNILYPKLKHKKEKKTEQLTSWVQRYVNELDNFTKKYPYQCFLFNNIWDINSG